MSKTYGYCREVTFKGISEKKLEEQSDEIKKVYPDAQIITETVGTEVYNRPLFNDMVENSKSGDVVVCTKLDRLCKSIGECVDVVNELMSKGVTIHILNMGIIDDSETGKLIYKNLLAFYEFQKAVKIDRMNSKKEIYSANNQINLGRPRKYTDEEIRNAMKLLEDHTYTEVEKRTGISKGTLWREKLKISQEV